MRVVVWEIAGIECYLFDENIVSLDWLGSNLLGGGKLAVRKRDVEESERLLGQNVAEKLIWKERANTNSRYVRSAVRWNRALRD